MGGGKFVTTKKVSLSIHVQPASHTDMPNLSMFCLNQKRLSDSSELLVGCVKASGKCRFCKDQIISLLSFDLRKKTRSSQSSNPQGPRYAKERSGGFCELSRLLNRQNVKIVYRKWCESPDLPKENQYQMP